MLTSVLPWLAAHVIFSFCAAPLMFRVCTRLHDRGYGLSKVIGLLLVTFGTWWLASLPIDGPYTRFGFRSISIALLFVLTLSAISFLLAHRDMAAFVRSRWRVLATYELIGLAAFALMAMFRATVPHISYHNATDGFIDHASEKFTDFAILNSLLTSDKFPPHDAWLSGSSLNYYYFGHLLWACMIKYTSVLPEIGFNLALASLFALVSQQAFSLGYNLTRRVRWGFMALFLIVLSSNLDGFLQLLGIVSQKLFGPTGGRQWTMHGDFWMNYNFWRSSRAIENTINEFPAFSFVLGDLHGHVSSLAIYLAGLGLSLQIWRSARRFHSLFSYEWHCLDELFFAALVTGALYAANSWDAITYGGVIMMTLWASQGGHRGSIGPRSSAVWRLGAGAASAVLAGIVILIGMLALFRPFHLNYIPPVPWPTLREAAAADNLSELNWPIKATRPESRSDFFEWVSHWVLHLAAPALLALICARRRWLNAAAHSSRLGPQDSDPRQKIIALLCVAAATGCVLMPLWGGWIAILTFLALVGGLAAFCGWQPPALRLILAWLILFCGLTWFCELLYFDDIFSDDIERINTVFKIYYGLWPLAGLACVVALRRLIRYGGGIPRGRVVIAVLLVVGGTYTALAPIQRIGSSSRLGMASPRHENKPEEEALPMWARKSAKAKTVDEALDGMRYLQYIHPNDYLAVLWARAELSSNTVILEAPGTQYTYAGRFGALTGRPVFAGWLAHEWGWRNGTGWKDKSGMKAEFGPEMQRRLGVAREIYETTDALRAHRLLRKEGIEYVVLGDAERDQAEREQYVLAEEKFFRMGEMAFAESATLICKISENPPLPLPETPAPVSPPLPMPPKEFESDEFRFDSPIASDFFTTSTKLTTGTPTTETLKGDDRTSSIFQRILDFGMPRVAEVETPKEPGAPWD